MVCIAADVIYRQCHRHCKCRSIFCLTFRKLDYVRACISGLSRLDFYHIRLNLLLLRPGRWAEYCDRFVCLCVCLSVRENISGTAGPIFTKFCTRIPCGRGSVLLGRRCDTLCTSGFVDDVTFGRSGPYGGRCDTEVESDVCECLVEVCFKNLSDKFNVTMCYLCRLWKFQTWL